ncbi:NAD(P)H-dependent oxidoreductase [Undibacterium sp. TC4M20W]|uniref:NAD(P)H-dependent oxidoreductase n=1 Tax=Undibacterium sp. TC4M20W TaxID=3413052 RepID=UPI003BF16D59
MKHALIINAHQFYEGISSGKLNLSMADIIKTELQNRDYQVRQTQIEQGYDINAEVQNHLWADLIILQSPVYWFGMPWIYKKYVDEVFTAGMMQQSFLDGDGRTHEDLSKQYGSGGKLHGKKYMLSLTWNAPEAAFGDTAQSLFEGKTVDDVFIANTANYKFCGVDVLPAFSCHDVIKQPDIDNDMARLRAHLANVI